MTNYSKKILDAVNYMIEQAIASAPFDKVKNAKVINKNLDGTYQVSIEGKIYDIPSYSSVDYTEGTIVRVMIPQNNYSAMFILS